MIDTFACKNFLPVVFIIITGDTWSTHWITAHNEKKKCESATPDSSLLRRERVQVHTIYHKIPYDNFRNNNIIIK